MDVLDQTLEKLAQSTVPVLPHEVFEKIRTDGTIEERGKLYDFYLTFGESAFGSTQQSSLHGEDFTVKYLADCLVFPNGHGEHMGCYEAGWEITRLLGHALRQQRLSFAGSLLRMVDNAFCSGNAEQRICIENAFLEHAIEDSVAAPFVSSQNVSAELHAAIRSAATERSNRAISSPLARQSPD